MRDVRIPLLAVAGLLTLTGCTSPSDALSEYLADEWGFSDTYEVVENGEVTVEDGNAVVATDLESFNYTQAEQICLWVSTWVYGNGDEDSTVQVLDKGGSVIIKREHENDSCGA